MTQENASLKPTDMTPEVPPEYDGENAPVEKPVAKTRTKAKTKAKAKATSKKEGAKRNIKQTEAYKVVMVDVKPHLHTLCDALRLHRASNNRTFSKVKRTIMDALSTVSKERKDGLARRRETVRKDQEKAKDKKVQDRIAKAEERLKALKSAAGKSRKS